MRNKFSWCLFMVLLSFNSISAQRKTDNSNSNKAPNILFFLVDDMGWQDCSLPFWDSITKQNRQFITPNMVSFAKTAEQFTSAYAASICTPSRVSLMTGMNVARHRVSNWTMFKDKGVDAEDSIMEPPKWNVNGLSPIPLERAVQVTTLPQILKEHGYYTIQCGKAHYGAYGTPAADPLQVGFIKNIGGSAAGNPASYLASEDFGYDPKHFNVRADIPNMQKYWGTNSFLTEDLTQEAKLAMDTARSLGKPFFLYMAHYAVHLPYNADARFVKKYLDQGFSKSEASYMALIEGMDHSFGELLAYLKENQLDKNTIIIFMSDNGGFSHPPRQGKEDTQNYPLRAGKGSLFEGGIREPMMIRWPGVTKAGSKARQYTIMEDFFPTILDMAGIKNTRTIQTIDGISLFPLLKDPTYTNSNRSLIWNFPNGWAGGTSSKDYSWMSAIRHGDWKLIYLEKYGELKLYNIRNDIKESLDLSKTYPKITKKMATLLTQKLKACHAQMPFFKATGKPAPFPDQL